MKKLPFLYVLVLMLLAPTALPAMEVINDDEAQDATELNSIDQRLEAEDKCEDNPFALTAHRPNYLLWYSHNFTPNNEPFEQGKEQVDNTEMKFQISLKYKMLENIFPENGDLYVAYTNQSYWQAFNDDLSSPFREINHEPEVWLQFRPNRRLGVVEFSDIAAGFTHESNGKGGTQSRSWNRVYLNLAFQTKHLLMQLKPWYRLPEDQKTDPANPHGDDNPNIEKYVGNGELTLAVNINGNTFSSVLRNNLRRRNKGSVELGWSFPLLRRLKGYVQYFNGYGESLIDYDAYSNRIGIGFLLTDWL